jgi:hypothetical protein
MSDTGRRPALIELDFATIGPRIGERFPDVRLPDQSGEIVDLHARRAGRRALFVVYRSASW